MAKTIEDLSKLMGISYATISRAMNRPDLVSPKTRKRILEGMREHRIYPNVSARNLKLRQTKILRVLVPETANYFYWEFLNVFRAAAYREKYEILLSTYDSAGSALDHSPKGVHTDSTVLIADPGVRDENHIREIESREHSSLILCGNLPVKDRYVVGSDDRVGMSALVRYFLSAGKKDLRFIHIQGGDYAVSERIRGFQDALQKAGLYDATRVIACDSRAEMMAVAAAFAKKRNYPEVLMAQNDHSAIALITAFREKGVEAGKDLVVSGYDNLLLRREMGFTFPTVDIDLAAQVDQVFEIVKSLQGRKAPERKAILIKGKVCGELE